ncbi:protein Cep78 homolog [Drosophila serrata]|uniref:protein Cep78 homolog n=1 Tax=Drosophila serrata TaxID=7274 RepID=UPI000A1D0026|nr:protein Cep78 homolog [Drosophila serrata]XP_020798540.1 protein Cep78 homolog [Drosophila serrata]XP_020798541.1 protein Cep78 homolog [Drosophila serrata]
MSVARMAQPKGNTNELARKSVLVTLPPVVKKSSKSRSFHFRYMELCRAKNLAPVPEIRSKSNATTTYLELCGDKLAVSDWLLLTEALHHDLVLQQLVVRLRRSYPQSNIDPVDTEKRARLFRQRPVIFTRFIFGSLVQAIANCVSSNKNLSVLKLEGLPLQDGYIETIAKSLADNECLETVSFSKSNIGDRGCEVVCNTAKYLNRIETFDLSECGLTSKGAEHVADMIRMQKITRFSEGWEKSLRYRSVDVNTIGGLRTILLANNPELGDDGVKMIAEVLKEDAWIKKIDMEGCGLTDVGANLILDCLALNTAIAEFNVRNNEGISKFLLRSIRDQLGEPAEEKVEPEYDLSCVNGLQSLPKNKKVTVSQLLGHIKTLEEQLSFERTLRKKAEKLNQKLSYHLMNTNSHNVVHEKGMELGGHPHMANEYVPIEISPEVNKDSQSYRQMHFSRLVNSAVTSPEVSPRSDMGTLRKDQQQQQQQQQQMHHQLKQQSPNHMQMQHPSLDQQLKQQSPTHIQMQHPSLDQPLRTLHEVEDMEPPEACASETEESAFEDQQYQQQTMLRKQLQVRKVRSETKYVETNTKDSKAKNHESKSDHEFANERDFKLNPAVQFETDIGDSAMVSPEKRYDGAGDADFDYAYEREQNMVKRGYENGYMGDNCGRTIPKPSGLAEALIQKRGTGKGYGGGDGHVAQFVNSLERRTNANVKMAKKRHKVKTEESLLQVQVNDMLMESYMSNYEELCSTDATVENSDNSDTETTDATLRAGSESGSGKFTPMQVFTRRKHTDGGVSMPPADSGGDGDAGGGNQKLSPRSAFLSMQQPKREQCS